MDVRAKQRLFYRVVFLTRSCVLVVSPHVISTVPAFCLKTRNQSTLRVSSKVVRR